MGKEMAVKIVNIGDVRNTKKAGNIIDLEVKTLDLGNVMKVGCFLNHKDFVFNLGDEVLMVISEGKPYQGKQTFMTSLENIHPIMNKDNPSIKTMFEKETSPKPVSFGHITKVEPKKEVDWDAKEKREHKRALTMQAFGLFPPRTNEDGLEPMDRWTAIRDMRDIMLTDLYND